MKYDNLIQEIAERFARRKNNAFDSLPSWIKKRNISAQKINAEIAMQFGYEMFQKGYVSAHLRSGTDPYEFLHMDASLNGIIPNEDGTDNKST